MLRIMWCAVQSSSSLSFPWWERKPRSSNAMPNLLGYLFVQEILSWWWLSACMFVCATDSAALSSSQGLCPPQYFDFKVEYPRKDSTSFFLTLLRNHNTGHRTTALWVVLSSPDATVTLCKGNVSITSKSKLWFNSPRSICLLMILQFPAASCLSVV